MKPSAEKLAAAHAELDALARDDATDVGARLAKLTNTIASWHPDKPGVLMVGRAAAGAAITFLLQHANATAEQLKDALKGKT